MSETPATYAAAKLAELELRNQRRTLRPTDRQDSIRVLRPTPAGAQQLISFCCNDYLNLTGDARLKAAAKAAVDRYGVGAGASRLITGDHPLLGELETALARLKGTEDAVVFGSGYLANLGIIPTLVGAGDLVMADELSHACLMAGGQLSGAKMITFAHNDMEDLTAHLSAQRACHGRCLIVTDGVFSMDGDLAPLVDLSAIATRFDAWLMTDDAHGIGTIGGGRGSTFAHGAPVTVPLQMGTLSKAVGSYGGYLCADKVVCDLIKTRARTLVYSTGLPPASAAAALAALQIISVEPEFCALPVEKAKRFCRALNLPDPQSPIVPLLLGAEEAALAGSVTLEEAGFLVTAIRPPTVPTGTARLRFTFTANHSDKDIDRLAGCVRDLTLSAAAE